MVSAFIVAFTWLPAEAVVVADVAGDFKLVSGYIIMEADGEYIIDLDASKGVLTGDLFSVVRPGKKDHTPEKWKSPWDPH
jgi:hypothetical protein